jgi:hypothetical protein
MEGIHDLEPRIERLYRRDQWIAVILVVALVGTLWIVWWATHLFASGEVRVALAVAGSLLVAFNGASIWALLRHNREDKTYIYALDIKHLDEYRVAQATRKSNGR